MNWLITALYGLRREDRELRAGMVGAFAEGKRPERIPEVAATIINRHAPVAAAMSAFMRAFQHKSRSTPYPDEEIRRLLRGRGAALLGSAVSEPDPDR
ncbi:hypothetical protein [Nocardia carnea]|uniref:hypothetical protein n=1 Tax=Nocardia carnea TaxID=37328 RepID=UPI002453A5BF|nr:hypothetical protein [Nocardia carnea]